MWYFSWILGVGLACSFGILNAMWFEFRDEAEQSKSHTSDSHQAT